MELFDWFKCMHEEELHRRDTERQRIEAGFCLTPTAPQAGGGAGLLRRIDSASPAHSTLSTISGAMSPGLPEPLHSSESQRARSAEGGTRHSMRGGGARGGAALAPRARSCTEGVQSPRLFEGMAQAIPEEDMMFSDDEELCGSLGPLAVLAGGPRKHALSHHWDAHAAPPAHSTTAAVGTAGVSAGGVLSLGSVLLGPPSPVAPGGPSALHACGEDSLDSTLGDSMDEQDEQPSFPLQGGGAGGLGRVCPALASEPAMDEA